MKRVNLFWKIQCMRTGLVCMLGVVTGVGVPEAVCGASPTLSYRDDTTYCVSRPIPNLSPFDTAAVAGTQNVIGDTGFQRGAFLIAPPEGKWEIERFLDFGSAGANPAKACWSIPQWSSRFSLKEEPLRVYPDGSRGYANAAKTIRVRPDGAFTLELYASQEYGNRPRQGGEPWPHLYISQSLGKEADGGVPLSGSSQVWFTLQGRRNFCRNYMGTDFDPGMHTIHMVLTITLSYWDPSSALHGRYLNFQLPVYDYRWDFPPAGYALDAGVKPTTTGMFIYSEAGDHIWDGTFKDGQWHTAQLDILPMIRRAVEQWKQSGQGYDRIDMEKLRLSSFIMGWESEGTFDASMSFRGLGLWRVPLSH